MSKLFEIRDHGTCIPALAIKIDVNAASSAKERWLLIRAGFGPSSSSIYLIDLCAQRANYDAYNWGNRTMQAAHLMLEDDYDTLNSGDLIDVRVLLNEATEPCESDMQPMEAK